jgi:hypothetical protein
MKAVRKMQLVRLGIWAGVATLAVLVAVIAANTETGVHRIAGLITPDEAPRGARGPNGLATRSFDAELEARRLSDAVRVLAADRDRLLTRVAVLERSLDDVTGSIPSQQPAAAAPKSAPLLPQIPPQVSAPATTPAVPVTAVAPTPAPAPAPAAPPSRVTVSNEPMSGGPAQSIATKTDFGIDIGGNASLDGLRVLWTNLKAAQPALLEGLRPVIAIREAGKPGTVELRLVAGPLANAGAAARLCAALTAAGQVCQTTVFDGQRLALQ